MARDQAEAQELDAALRQAVAEIKQLEEKMTHVTQHAASAAFQAQGQGGPGSSSDMSPTERAEKYVMLEEQEREMRNFLQGTWRGRGETQRRGGWV